MVNSDKLVGSDRAASALALAVVREGLANVARHAGPVAVDVVVGSDGEALCVEVADAGPAPGWVAHPGTGTGLTSLAERATALGAQLSAGPRPPVSVEPAPAGAEQPEQVPAGTDASPTTGFRLSARIPLDTGERP